LGIDFFVVKNSSLFSARMEKFERQTPTRLLERASRVFLLTEGDGSLPRTMSPVILSGLTKTFAAEPAVADVDLEIGAGELLVVLGANGSGKTTLLRLIAGLESPTRGSVRIGEREVTRLPPHQRSVGLVFQDAVLEPTWTVRQQLDFPLSAGSRLAARDRAQRIDQVAGQLGLEAWLDRWVSELSGGQQQRVAIGRSLIRRPDVLLLDEPFANLDPAGKWELRRQLRPWLAASGATAVHVTHDAVEAQCLADRIAVLEGGRLLQVASPGDLRRQPEHWSVLQSLATWPVNVVEIAEAGLLWAAHASDVRLRAGQAASDWPAAEIVRVSEVGGQRLVEFRWKLAGEPISGWSVCSATEEIGAAGQWVQIEIETAKIHWFEAATGRRHSAGKGLEWLAAKRRTWKGGE
jgi:ABC-type sugar transport system ATPase subunit